MLIFSFVRHYVFFDLHISALNHVHGLKLRITSLNDGFQSEIPQTMFVAASIHSLNYGIQFEMPQHVPGLNCACQQLAVCTTARQSGEHTAANPSVLRSSPSGSTHIVSDPPPSPAKILVVCSVEFCHSRGADV